MFLIWLLSVIICCPHACSAADSAGTHTPTHPAQSDCGEASILPGTWLKAEHPGHSGTCWAVVPQAPGWSLPAEPQSALSPGSISWGLDSTWHLLAHFSQRLDSGPDFWFHVVQGPQGPASTQASRHQPPVPPPPPRLVAEPQALIPSPHFHPLPLLNANLGGIFWCQQTGNAEGEAIPR